MKHFLCVTSACESDIFAAADILSFISHFKLYIFTVFSISDNRKLLPLSKLGANLYITSFRSSLMLRTNKLECLSLASSYRKVEFC